MADYQLIFVLCILLNSAITCRASRLYFYFKDKVCNSGAENKLCAVADREGIGSDAEKKDSSKDQCDLLLRYLAVYLLATMSDWLQGPYVYALYDAYGYSRQTIAILFVAAYASSMIFGSLIGSMADGCGRRFFVFVYCAVYAASCVTKHFNDFYVLLLGRLLSGIATSLLFSVFDAWFICAHSIAGVDKSALARSFSWAAYGNSIIAIVAGLIANRVASNQDLVPLFERRFEQKGSSETATVAVLYRGGYLNPFDVAFFSLCACGIAALCLWKENFGHQNSGFGGSGNAHTVSGADGTMNEMYTPLRTHINSWKIALFTVLRSKEMLMCGIISSLFEGSMYIFVFMWTPALKGLVAPVRDVNAEGDPVVWHRLPYGLIFSTFMVCCMAGSSAFAVAVEKGAMLESLAVRIFVFSSLAMSVIALAPNDTVAFLGMNAFEGCVGMYFPTMGIIKSTVVPEHARAAIYNLYRVPLNFIVLVSLLNNFTVTQAFGQCSIMLGVAALLQLRLQRIRSTAAKRPREKADDAEEHSCPLSPNDSHDEGIRAKSERRRKPVSSPIRLEGGRDILGTP